MEFDNVRKKQVKEFGLGLEQSLLNPPVAPTEIDYADLLEKSAQSVYHYLQKKEIISMIRGSQPHERYRSHPLLKKAGYYRGWDGLSSLSRSELIAVCILSQRG